jgi:hypothetical protein
VFTFKCARTSTNRAVPRLIAAYQKKSVKNAGQKVKAKRMKNNHKLNICDCSTPVSSVGGGCGRKTNQEFFVPESMNYARLALQMTTEGMNASSIHKPNKGTLFRLLVLTSLSLSLLLCLCL